MTIEVDSDEEIIGLLEHIAGLLEHIVEHICDDEKHEPAPEDNGVVFD